MQCLLKDVSQFIVCVIYNLQILFNAELKVVVSPVIFNLLSNHLSENTDEIIEAFF